MKQVILAIFVFLASMPVQASCESMHASQESPQSQHGQMSGDHGMDHSQMDHEKMDTSMDCCEHDPVDPAGSCDPVSSCRVPVFNYVLIDPVPVNEVDIAHQTHVSTDTSAPISLFLTPPLRPPIS